MAAALDAGFGVEGFEPIGPSADPGAVVLTLVLGVFEAVALWLPRCALLLVLSVSSLPDEVYEVGLELTLLSILSASLQGSCDRHGLYVGHTLSVHTLFRLYSLSLVDDTVFTPGHNFFWFQRRLSGPFSAVLSDCLEASTESGHE